MILNESQLKNLISRLVSEARKKSPPEPEEDVNFSEILKSGNEISVYLKDSDEPFSTATVSKDGQYVITGVFGESDQQFIGVEREGAAVDSETFQSQAGNSARDTTGLITRIIDVLDLDTFLFAFFLNYYDTPLDAAKVNTKLRRLLRNDSFKAFFDSKVKKSSGDFSREDFTVKTVTGNEVSLSDEADQRDAEGDANPRVAMEPIERLKSITFKKQISDLTGKKSLVYSPDAATTVAVILIADIEKIPVMSYATARALRRRELVEAQKKTVEKELQTLYAATKDNLYLRVRVAEPLDKVASHLNQLLDTGNYKIGIDEKMFLPSKMTDDSADEDALDQLERLKSGTKQGPGTFKL